MAQNFADSASRLHSVAEVVTVVTFLFRTRGNAIGTSRVYDAYADMDRTGSVFLNWD
jgi:hypothetical protein